MKKKSAIAVVGLGVMGQNLARNIATKGYAVSVYNRHPDKTQAFMSSFAQEATFTACSSLEELTESLEHPRKILLMVPAGAAVDEMLAALKPLLDAKDLIIDAGNSYYVDTQRRVEECEKAGLYYIGCGVSGGEEGALHGPSIMPGGMKEAWPYVKEIFAQIAAKAPDGSPCCHWIGSGGAGHFVKMVHNGIEYGDMQLIAESFAMMRDLYGLDQDQMADIFWHWNNGKLSSYLIEITYQVLQKKEDGEFLLSKIQDIAGQKGTGKWSVDCANTLGVTLSVIAEAVNQRNLSLAKDRREFLSKRYDLPNQQLILTPKQTEAMEQALFASKIISYEQGFALMHTASKVYQWELDLGEIASLWRAGCIIRSAFLDNITHAFRLNPNLESLLLDEFFEEQLKRCLVNWQQMMGTALARGVAIPAHCAALNYLYAQLTALLPTNLIQGQRDLFGAHTYERNDRPRGEFFHTQW